MEAFNVLYSTYVQKKIGKAIEIRSVKRKIVKYAHHEIKKAVSIK